MLNAVIQTSFKSSRMSLLVEAELCREGFMEKVQSEEDFDGPHGRTT